MSWARVSLCSLSLLRATAHKLSVNFFFALDNLFWSMLDVLTGLSTAPLPCMLFKGCLFFCCLLHCGSCSGPWEFLPGTHQGRAPTLFRGCWSVVLSMSLVYASKHVQRDFTALFLWFRVIHGHWNVKLFPS